MPGPKDDAKFSLFGLSGSKFLVEIFNGAVFTRRLLSPRTLRRSCSIAVAVSRPFCRTAFSSTSRDKGVLVLLLRPAV